MRGRFAVAVVALMLAGCTDGGGGSSASPTPVDLASVPGFSVGIGSSDAELATEEAAFELWRDWQMGRVTRDCMRDAGYEWQLEVAPNRLLSMVLDHFGRDATVPIGFEQPPFSTQPNDDAMASLSAGEQEAALEALYGDRASLDARAQDFFHEHEQLGGPDPDAAADAAVRDLLEFPRTSREIGGGVLAEVAGGCVGKARDALPEYARPSAALSEAFDEAVRSGDPGDLDAFASDHAGELTARRDGIAALMSSLQDDEDFAAFLDDVERALAGA